MDGLGDWWSVRDGWPGKMQGERKKKNESVLFQIKQNYLLTRKNEKQNDLSASVAGQTMTSECTVLRLTAIVDYTYNTYLQIKKIKQKSKNLHNIADNYVQEEEEEEGNGRLP